MTSLFKSKKIKSETLGEYLADMRNTLKMTCAQVQRLTQIPEKFLKNLEAGEYGKLPDDVYVRGFLQSLAAVYKLPAKSLLEQFERERGVDRSLTSRDPLAPRASKPFITPRIVITPKTFSLALVLVLAALSVGYLVWQVRSVSAAPSLEISYPAADLTTEARNILLRGRAEPGSKLFINKQPVLVAEDGEFTEVLNLTEGANNILIRAENKFGKSSEVSRSIIVSSAPETATGTAGIIGEAVGMKVVVEVGPGNAWIKAVVDGQVAQEGELAGGTKAEFRAENEILVSTGNAGATRLIYNGQDLGVLGKSGEALADIKFTVE
ncbi:MAG: RodZ domain-containing protein [Patescibacteria group bacterium]